MRKSDFNYQLPSTQIAQSPVTPRSASRLLYVDPLDGLRDLKFSDFPGLIQRGDLLVFNDTRVLPARLYARKSTGGRVEMIIERLLDDKRALTQLRVSKPPKIGQRLEFDEGITAEVLSRDGEFYVVRFEGAGAVIEILERIGHVPLPPYITRSDAKGDRTAYQTVYARHPGAVAAPTAGLHFDEGTFSTLATRGVGTVFLTLHVGAGTFQPMRVEDIATHRMHPERIKVDAEVCRQVNSTRAAGGRIIAVGTTVVRALESAAVQSEIDASSPLAIQPFEGETEMFIYPGYRFRVVDGLLTNFHLPESTLLMLVCALGGTPAVMAAYRHAVERQYRFYSYGDAMFLWRVPHSRNEAGPKL